MSVSIDDISIDDISTNDIISLANDKKVFAEQQWNIFLKSGDEDKRLKAYPSYQLASEVLDFVTEYETSKELQNEAIRMRTTDDKKKIDIGNAVRDLIMELMEQKKQELKQKLADDTTQEEVQRDPLIKSLIQVVAKDHEKANVEYQTALKNHQEAQRAYKKALKKNEERFKAKEKQDPDEIDRLNNILAKAGVVRGKAKEKLDRSKEFLDFVRTRTQDEIKNEIEKRKNILEQAERTADSLYLAVTKALGSGSSKNSSLARKKYDDAIIELEEANRLFEMANKAGILLEGIKKALIQKSREDAAVLMQSATHPVIFSSSVASFGGGGVQAALPSLDELLFKGNVHSYVQEGIVKQYDQMRPRKEQSQERKHQSQFLEDFSKFVNDLSVDDVDLMNTEKGNPQALKLLILLGACEKVKEQIESQIKERWTFVRKSKLLDNLKERTRELTEEIAKLSIKGRTETPTLDQINQIKKTSITMFNRLTIQNKVLFTSKWDKLSTVSSKEDISQPEYNGYLNRVGITLPTPASRNKPGRSDG